MVLHQGTRGIARITAILGIALPLGQGISQEQALLKAQQFCRVAARGRTAQPIELPTWSATRVSFFGRMSAPHRSVWLNFGDGISSVAVTDEGRVRSAALPSADSLPQTWQTGRALSTPALLEVAQQCFEAAGFDGQLRLNYCRRATDSRSDRCFELSAAPSFRGVPYSFGYESTFTVEHTTGRLEDMSLPYDELPTPPASLNPGISLNNASAMIASFLRNHEGVSRAYFYAPTELGIWGPRRLNGFDGLNQEDLNRQAAGQGMLVYYGVVFDLDRTSADLRTTWGSYGVIVDAEDGRVITMWANRAGGFGGGAKAPSPYSWNLDEPHRAGTTGHQTLHRGPIRVDFVKFTQKPPFTGKPVNLTCGRITYAAQFDPGSGLLSIRTHGRHSIGRPDGRVAAALRKIK